MHHITSGEPLRNIHLVALTVWLTHNTCPVKAGNYLVIPIINTTHVRCDWAGPLCINCWHWYRKYLDESKGMQNYLDWTNYFLSFVPASHHSHSNLNHNHNLSVYLKKKNGLVKKTAHWTHRFTCGLCFSAVASDVLGFEYSVPYMCV